MSLLSIEPRDYIDVKSPKLIASALGASAIALILQFLFPPTFENKASNKKKVHKIVGLIAASFAATGFLMWNSWDAVKHRREVFADYPRYEDGYLSLFSFSFLTITKVVLIPLFRGVGRLLISKEKHGERYEMKVQRFSVQLWKFIYHTSMTILPLYLFKNEKWWPPGPGENFRVFENYPYTPVAPWMREFYMFQLGYYIHSFVYTLMQTGRADLVFMTVHHIAAFELIFMSYFLSNSLRIGVLVLFVHDVCDIFICLIRIVADSKFSSLIIVTYPVAMIVWFIFRLAIFPTRIIYVAMYTIAMQTDMKWEDAYAEVPLTLLLIVLFVMHWIWFVELLHMGSKYLKTGCTEDTTALHKNEKEKYN